MTIAVLKSLGLEKEMKFKTSRSSGKGGQNVNKVETRVELFFDVNSSQVLDEETKILIGKKCKNKISESGELHLAEESERSQLKNKELIIKKFYELVAKALVKPKTRKPTKVSKAVKEKRLKEKKWRSEIKSNRRTID